MQAKKRPPRISNNFTMKKPMMITSDRGKDGRSKGGNNATEHGPPRAKTKRKIVKSTQSSAKKFTLRNVFPTKKFWWEARRGSTSER